MSKLKGKPAPGIEVRHGRGCPSSKGGRCGCVPGYRPRIWDPRAGKKGRWIHGPTFTNPAEAQNWRQDNIGAARRGVLRAPSEMTFGVAADELIAGMKTGAILNRSGCPYKPEPRRRYEQLLRAHAVPFFGRDTRLSAIKRARVQEYIDAICAQGVAPATVANRLDPVRVIFRRAMRDDVITVDPTKGLELPRIRNTRNRVESPETAIRLVAALPESERALWATAFFAGLRRGELRALRWTAIDLDANVVRVERGWDDKEGEIDVKSDAGHRTVPLASRLRRELLAHKLRTGRGGDDLVFGRTADLPFVPSTVDDRAYTAWGWRRVRNPSPTGPRTTWVKASEDALDKLSLHEARHCAASFLIAAEVNPKELQTYIGHSEIRTTFNVYGHLLPGSERAAAAKLDVLFGEAETG